MSGGTNNFTPTSRNWQGGRGYGDYAPNSSDGSRTQTRFPQFGSISFRAEPDASRSASHPRPLLEERVITGSVGLAGFPVPSHSPMQVLGREVNPSHRQGFMRQQNVPVPTLEDDSRLTRDEQQTALKKLKKGIYDPPQKRRPRPSLYYRLDAKTVLKEMEKEKKFDVTSCTVCLEEFEPKERVMLTPCNHMFHEVCIVPWVRSQGQCPVCRFALCEPQREHMSRNDIMNVAGNNSIGAELISVLRALDEGSIWDYSRFFQL